MLSTIILTGMLAAPALAPAQGPPQAAPPVESKGSRALQKLIERCADDGGLKPAKDPKSGEVGYALGDRRRLDQTIRAEVGALTPELRDAMTAEARRGRIERPALIALLGSIGEAAGDDRCRARASLLESEGAADDGDPARVLKLLEAAAGQFESAGDRVMQSQCLSNMGVVFLRQDRAAEALPPLERALAIYRKAVETPDRELASCLNNLGAARDRLGDPRGAIAAHQEALKIRRRLFGGQNLEVAQSLFLLGQAQAHANRPREARASLEEALAIRRPLLGDRNPLLARTYNELGGVYDLSGDKSGSLEMFLEALAIYRRIHAQPHGDIAHALNNVGAAYSDLEKPAEALKCYRESLEIWKATRGDENAEAAACIHNLGSLMMRQRQFVEARALLERALAIRRKVLGDDPAVAQTLNSLGGLYADQAEFDRARAHFAQALDVWKRKNVSEHFEIAAIHDNLGDVLAQQGKLREALEEHLGALEMMRKLLGPGHPRLIPSLGNLGKLYSQMSRDEDALKLLGEALEIAERNPRGNQRDAAVTLSSIAGVHFKKGRLKEANEALERSIAIDRRLLGPDHPALAIALTNQSIIRRSTGDFEKAVECTREALRIMRTAYPKGHPQIAQILVQLGDLYRTRGEFDLALPTLREALDLWRGFHPADDHPTTALLLNNLALVHAERADYVEALSLEHRALEILREKYGKEHPSYADQLNNLAWVYNRQGRYAEAISALKEAESIRRKRDGERTPALALTLMSLGVNLDHVGETDAGLERLEEALAILRTRLGENHPDVVVCLNNLAGVYSGRGDYGRALSIYLRADAIQRTRPTRDLPGVVTRLNNMGTAYDHLGEHRAAEACHREALAIAQRLYGPGHPQVARIRNNLGSVYMLNRRYREAEAEFGKALEVWERVLGDRNLEVANVYNNLGGVHELQGQLDEARRDYDRGLQMRREVLGSERHFQVAQSLNNLASVLEKQGKYAEAIRTDDRALESLRIDRDPKPLDLSRNPTASLRPVPLTVTVLKHRGSAMEKLYGERATPDQLRECLGTYEVAARMLERVRGEALEDDISKIVLGANESGVFSRQVGLCARIAERDPGAGPRALSDGFTAAERGLAQVLLEGAGRSRARIIGRVAPTLLDEERRLRALEKACEETLAGELSRPTLKIDHPRVEALEKERDDLERRLVELAERMKAQHPGFASRMFPKSCSVAEARSCLGENEVALLYILGDPDSHLVVLSRQVDRPGGGIAIHRLPRAAEIRNRLAPLLAGRESVPFDRTAQVKALGGEAYELLLGPAGDAIRGKDLVIVPSGFLGRFPFHLLVEPGGDVRAQPFLIERHRIRFAPSLSVLNLGREWDRTRTRPSEPFWAVGDPIYQVDDPRLAAGRKLAESGRSPAPATAPGEILRSDPGTTARFPRLEGSGVEVRTLAQLMGAPPERALTGPEATEEGIKKASRSGRLAEARFLHFAVHGSLESGRGQQPCLVLSLFGRADRPTDDGFLDLEEVTQLRLNADLVVLSACETNRGRIYDGEGVLSLARGFLHAGSRGVLCSLWKVDDRPTLDLMSEVYRNLRAGRTAPESLRAAQIEMIARGATPRSWAPFILIGE